MVIMAICTKNRHELLFNLIDKFEEVGKIVVVDSSANPVSGLSEYYYLPQFTIAMARAWVLKKYRDEKILMIDDNVDVDVEEVNKLIDYPMADDVGILTANFGNLYFKDEEEEVVNPYKLYLLNIRHNYDIHLPNGVFEDKQIGIDTWLLGKRVVRVPIKFKRKYGKGGVLNEDVRSKEKRQKYFEIGGRYFMKRYNFVNFSADYRMLVGVKQLKRLGGQYNNLILNTTVSANRLGEDSIYDPSPSPSIFDYLQ